LADHHMKTLMCFEEGTTSNDIIPVYYGIEVTRNCNLACIMCPHPSFSKDEKGNMEEDVFKEIINKISPFAKLIKLHWIGEPLLHPGIIGMISNRQRVRSFLATCLSIPTILYMARPFDSN